MNFVLEKMEEKELAIRQGLIYGTFENSFIALDSSLRFPLYVSIHIYTHRIEQKKKEKHLTQSADDIKEICV